MEISFTDTIPETRSSALDYLTKTWGALLKQKTKPIPSVRLMVFHKVVMGIGNRRIRGGSMQQRKKHFYNVLRSVLELKHDLANVYPVSVGEIVPTENGMATIDVNFSFDPIPLQTA